MGFVFLDMLAGTLPPLPSNLTAGLERFGRLQVDYLLGYNPSGYSFVQVCTSLNPCICVHVESFSCRL